MESVQIENSADKYDYRNNNHKAAYDFVYNDDAFGVKLSTDLVYKPSEAEPP